MNRINRSRGRALVGAVAVATIAGMVLGVALVLNSSYNRSVFIKSDAEAALLLAEGGINDELNAITINLQAGNFGAATPPTQKAGEPYKGRKGSVEGTTGDYWVFTSKDPEGNEPWDGTSTFYVTANAVVNGSARKVRIGGPNQKFQSPFSSFALFGLDNASGSNQANIGLAGANTVVQVIGVAGTNGSIQSGSGQISFSAAFNYNADAFATAPDSQFVGSNVFRKSERLVLPTVTDVIRQTVPATKGMSDADAWTYIRTNLANVTSTKQWKSGLSAGATLSPTTVQSANFASSGGGQYVLVNKSGSTLGRWNSLNNAPGSSTKKTLIFQPGDYYFEKIDLGDNQNTEFIIDNAGLTMAGGNPNRMPVRFFVAGTGQQDNIAIEVKQTDPSDPGALRVFYNKPGCVFNIIRPSSWTSGTSMNTTCGVYAVTGITGNGGTRISVVGGNAVNDWININGSLIADRVEFNGRIRVSFPGEGSARPNDPISGVGYSTGYYDGR
jgi:hypothetical protein